MNLLNVGRPSIAKAKAIRDLEKKEEVLLGVEIPISLKKRLMQHIACSNTKLNIKIIVTSLLEEYLTEAEATNEEEYYVIRR